MKLITEKNKPINRLWADVYTMAAKASGFPIGLVERDGHFYLAFSFPNGSNPMNLFTAAEMIISTMTKNQIENEYKIDMASLQDDIGVSATISENNDIPILYFTQLEVEKTLAIN